MVNEAEHVTFKIAKLNGIELNSFFKIRPVFAIVSICFIYEIVVSIILSDLCH